MPKSHYPTPVEGPTAVTRDGVLLALVPDSNAAFAYIQRMQGQSVEWACRYEGWSWRPATAEERARHNNPNTPKGGA